MANEAKVLLTVITEGGTLKQGEVITKKWYLTKKDMFPGQTFKHNDGDKIIRSGKYKSRPLIAEDCLIKIKLNADAYEAMISATMPEWFHKQKEWRKMSADERLRIHLARISESLNGKSFTYQIVEG